MFKVNDKKRRSGVFIVNLGTCFTYFLSVSITDFE